ncbi:PREDICTED: lung adenoma susceptibility protein 2 [Merops nubicus]|uniref:lung adenoma susceptibility protein 2 n=1 Tax=Merops nubicus TaxID=57421 RepID=UPI0004F06C9A|nr:PREDICTED: lung adenoma susceptibility protein 2 [Merops nubicus]
MESMASSTEGSSVCSPDSTISSLLASCSIDSSNPCSHSFIHYKDKLYSSASEALEAYIEDFNLSLTSSGVSTGKIHIYQSTPKQIKFVKHRAKGKPGRSLQMGSPCDCNQHVGLDSFAPAPGRQSECDPDLVSLATDDLLAFPADGSLPFAQRAPVEPRQQSSEWRGRSLRTLFCPYQSSSLHSRSGCRLQEDSKAAAHQSPHKDSSKRKHSVHTPDGCSSASSKASSRTLCFDGNSDTFPVKNYPRWLTSQKSDLSVSGISSIPNIHYPAWLKSYNLFSASVKESDGQTFNPRGTAASSQAFEILEKRHFGEKDSSHLLEQDGWLDVRGDNQAEESSNCDNPEELLTLKADRGLESSPEDFSNHLEGDDSPSTTAVLGAERSWEVASGPLQHQLPGCCEDMERALPFPKAQIIQKFLEDCLKDKNQEDAFSEGLHHRPLEALKLLLFKLQAIQGSLSQDETTERKEELEELYDKAEAELKLCDSEKIPLTNSIRKALHHLSHLGRLVGENSSQQEQANDCEEDKQGKETHL